MDLMIPSIVALLASILTFFSGFGLGTLLLPAFALFFPVEQAVAMTAVVHFLNNLVKLALTGRYLDRKVLLRFGLPAIIASLLGAWLLVRLAGGAPAFAWHGFGRDFAVMPVELVVGALLLAFALVELVPRWRDASFDARWMPLGGVLSGFFGGLSGMQGALRSAFLARAGLDKQAFIGTGVAIACLVDFTRLGVYAKALAGQHQALRYDVLAAAVAAATLGAILGNRMLHKMTMPGVQRLVAALLFVVALGMVTGLL